MAKESVNPMAKVEQAAPSIEQLTADYVKQQREAFEAKITERAQAYAEKLKNKEGRDYKVLMLRVHLQQVRNEIMGLKLERKRVGAQIKQIKAEAKAKKKGKDVTAQVKAEQAPAPAKSA